MPSRHPWNSRSCFSHPVALASFPTDVPLVGRYRATPVPSPRQAPADATSCRPPAMKCDAVRTSGPLGGLPGRLLRTPGSCRRETPFQVELSKSSTPSGEGRPRVADHLPRKPLNLRRKRTLARCVNEPDRTFGRAALAWRAARCWAWLLSICCSAAAWAAENPVPRPPELERDVQFWVRVYSQIDTNSGFLHDQYNLGIVYDTLHFAPNTAPAERQRQVDDERQQLAAALKRIAAAGSAPLSPEDQRIKELWGAEGTPERLLAAVDDIRFQLGQSDRFRDGPGALGRLGDAHRGDAGEPRAAAGAGGAAARGVLVQPGGLLQGRRGGPVAVHALHRAALHAHRLRGGRPAGSVPLHRGRRAAAGLQLPPARHLAAGAHRLQPWQRRHAARQGDHGHRRHRARSCAATRAAASASPRATSTSPSWPRWRSTATRRSTSAPCSGSREAHFREVELPAYVSIAARSRAR